MLCMCNNWKEVEKAHKITLSRGSDRMTEKKRQKRTPNCQRSVSKANGCASRLAGIEEWSEWFHHPPDWASRERCSTCAELRNKTSIIIERLYLLPSAPNLTARESIRTYVSQVCTAGEESWKPTKQAVTMIIGFCHLKHDKSTHVHSLKSGKRIQILVKRDEGFQRSAGVDGRGSHHSG